MTGKEKPDNGKSEKTGREGVWSRLLHLLLFILVLEVCGRASPPPLPLGRACALRKMPRAGRRAVVRY